MLSRAQQQQPTAAAQTAGDDALAWKLTGAFAWHAAAVAAANVAWSLLLPVSTLGLLRAGPAAGYLMLYALQCASLLGQRAVLSANEYPPVTFPKLGVHGRTWVSLLLTRVVVRGRTVQSLTATAALFAANVVTAATYACLFPALKMGQGAGPPLGWSLRFGLLLGTWYSCSHLLRGCDVLTYPVLQRHRWFRLKERVPRALATAASSCAWALALMVLLGHGLPPARHLYAALLSGGLCALCWALGQAVLEVVFTERLLLVGPGEADPNAPLLAVLGSGSPMLQDLGLLDLASVAEGQGGLAAWRRAAIFADETGRAAWTPLAFYMLAEVRDFTQAVAAALPSAAVEAAGKGQGPGRPRGLGAGAPAAVRWNMLRLSPSTGMRLVSREQDLAAWNVRSKYQRVCWCLRGLAGLAVAAQRGEDRYGVVLLCEPTLPAVTAGLLSVVLALQQYVKVAAFARQPSALERLARHAGLVGSGLAGRTTNITLQPVEEVAFALEAAARNCLNRLALAYGEQLRGVLAAAAGGGQAAFKAPHGSPTELAALLGAVLACQDG